MELDYVTFKQINFKIQIIPILKTVHLTLFFFCYYFHFFYELSATVNPPPKWFSNT